MNCAFYFNRNYKISIADRLQQKKWEISRMPYKKNSFILWTNTNDLYVIFHQNLTFNLIEIISFLWTSCYKSDIHDRPLKYWSDDFNYTKHGGLQYGFKTEKTSQCKTCSQWGRKRPFLLSHCHTLKELWTRVSSRSITAQILLVSLLRTAGRRYFSAGL